MPIQPMGIGTLGYYTDECGVGIN